VRQWLARHPRWTFHFTPTSASWLNAVEGFFAKLTRQRLKRGVFRSVIDLQVAINRFSPRQTSIPNPSSGPPTQNACSPLSNGKSKR
jgi:transposase